MVDSYATGPEFLFVEFRWRGHQQLFPNAKLFAIGEIDETAEGIQHLLYCRQCQSAYEEWSEVQ